MFQFFLRCSLKISRLYFHRASFHNPKGKIKLDVSMFFAKKSRSHDFCTKRSSNSFLGNFQLPFSIYQIPFAILTKVRVLFQVVFVDLKPDPIDFFGIATITRSPSDSENGPWFYVDARKNPPFIEVSTFSITN